MIKSIFGILYLLLKNSYSAYNPNVYGSAVNADALTNYRIDTEKVSYKFWAMHTGVISSIRIYIMDRGTNTPARYETGNGGTWRISLRNDSTSNH